MLWRALRHVEGGFYIDVGAAHPDIDSVTRAFYDRGWNGIDIEPVAAAAARLTAARSRNITMQVAVGEKSGTADFFVVDGTGLSTMERSALPAIGKAGFAAELTIVEMTTLADICRDHAPADIHFLKIDVEGAERAVLLGADFVLFRPWIVLAEATAPMSTRETSGDWEPILLRAGYRFVYFDGLNRFYVAEERFDELAPHFSVPPNVFDDFLRVADTEWARRVADAQAQATDARSLARTRGDEVARLMPLVVSLQTAHRAALDAADLARNEARHAEARLQGLFRSKSWRATAPLRMIFSIVQAIRRRLLPALPAIPVAAAEPLPPNPQIQPLTPQPARLAPRQPTGHLPLRRTVHQFHSGSATGDAITNAMLLTRTLLRRQGYTSDIFVEHVDPLLANELRPMDELPVHAGYVLIVRHSMGYNAFDRIAALAAPKILIYHNITPPALLANSPSLQHYLNLGRTQLAQWRPLVSAALADSEFNAIELRRLGFDGAQACTLLFDPAFLCARAATKSAAHIDGIFTILFVGRVIPSKGQDDLIAAYAVFCRVFGAPSRLVLAGRHDGAGSAYFDALQTRIQAEELDAHVILTGLVSDDELHAWYSAADLYVSLSRHEGFGVPLIEAMAYNVPILALPAGAIPYTLAGTGETVPDAGPETVAASMLTLATDPARRSAVANRQRQSLDRFALDRQTQILMQALAQAGAAKPDDAATRTALGANMRFTIAGHVNKTYSLAAINRSLALTIEAARPGTVRLCPVEGQPTNDLSEVPSTILADIRRLAERPKPDSGPEMVISQHYPVFIPDDLGDIGVALFFWEESLIPARTIEQLNRSFHGVLAPSRTVAKALIDSGLSIPVRTIGYPPDLETFGALRERRVARQGTFTFLHVSSGFPRKGVDVLLAAFARAFGAADPVRLIIKVFPNPHNDIALQIERLRDRTPDLGEIVLIDRDIGEAELSGLYGEADTMVLPSRGEGFNLPAAEAMAAGIPLIVTGYGGHMDFCSNENARLIDYTFSPAASHLAAPHSLWVGPSEDDLVAALREAFLDRSAAADRARAALKAVASMRDRTGFVQRLTGAGVSLLLESPAEPVRIGWFSTWRVRCGIAGYSESLLTAMPEGTDISVFCDTRTDLNQTPPNGIRLWQSWRVGDPGSLPDLATAIAAADPHILVVQHQPGLLNWGVLSRLLTSPAAARRPVVVTLHNTRNLMDTPAGERATALAALAGIARVIVHTIADINFLKGLGLVANVTLLPHGASPRAPAPPPRLLTREDEAVIGCYGFFLPGKGIDTLIRAVAILRRQWPRARLQLVDADYGTPESAAEIAVCRALATELDVPVTWHTDFLPTARSLALLQECDIVALPYQPSKEASSAALRTSLSAGGVVAVTEIPIFEEAADAVFRFSGADPDSISQGLSELLGDNELRNRTQRAASRWLADRNWGDTAARLLGMLTGLTRAR